MVARLIITTKDRPELVQRAIESFGQTGLPITVYDQSEQRPAYTGLEQLVGPPEVDATIDRLAAKGFDRELLRWALIGGHGGYRNVALLDTVGQIVLSTDDDTVCEMLTSRPLDNGFRYGAPEFHWRLFESREAWLNSSLDMLRTTDVCAEHAKYVGQRTQDGYTFAVVAAGLIGDSASSFNNNFLAAEGKEHSRLISMYDELRETREVMQVASIATMQPGSSFLRTMNYSFDNRVELPPFPPNGRGECAVFATVLSLVPQTVVVYLPWAIVHVPPVGRKYENRFGPLTFDEAFYVIHDLSGAKSVEELGRALAALEKMPAAAMHSMMVATRAAKNEHLRATVRDKLKKLSGPPRWHSDCDELIAQSEVADQVLPEDSAKQQHALVMYGRLLLEWPRIRNAAK